MKLLDYFRNIRKRRFRPEPEKLDKFLEDNDQINWQNQFVVYEDIVDSYFREVNQKEQPVYYEFKEAFRKIVNRQQQYLMAVFDEGFSAESREQFFAAFKETIDYPSYNLRNTPLFFILFWRILMENFEGEMSVKGTSFNEETTKAFFAQFKQVSRAEFRRITDVDE